MKISFAKSVQGESHKRREKQEQRKFPCQDRSFAEKDIKAEDGTLFDFMAVSDGHGSSPHFRSGRGADFAIDVLKDILIRRFSTINELILSKEYETIRIKLAKAIVKRWREKIDTDLKENPVSEDEYEYLNTEDPDEVQKYKEGIGLYRIYGCTLVAYFATKTFWFALQIGDGDFSLSYDGDIFQHPMPKDEECKGSYTSSLCNEDSENKFRYCCSETIPCAAFCSSDGISKTWESPIFGQTPETIEELKRFFKIIYNIFYSFDYEECQKPSCRDSENHCNAECKKNLVINEINEYLPNFSKNGSGNDISLTGLINFDEDKNRIMHNKSITFMKDLNIIKDFCPSAYDFIKNKSKDAATGRYELENGAYVNVQEYTTKARNETKYESHKKFIDIQLILSGKELIAVAPIEKMKISEEYSEENDVMFFHPSDECTDYVLEEGDFLILYPKDVHMPCVCVNEKSSVRKIVVKVPVK